MVHDATVSIQCETPLRDTSTDAADVTQRTLDALPSIEQHVDATTIARKLGCSAEFIRDEMTRGKIAYLRIGRKRFVPVSAVEAYVAERAIGKHPARKAVEPTPIFSPSARRRTA